MNAEIRNQLTPLVNIVELLKAMKIAKNKADFKKVVEYENLLIDNIESAQTSINNICNMNFSKNVLLVIDPQNDFIEGGALPVPGGKKALDNLIEWYNSDLISDVFITIDYHPKNHCSFKENGGEWPKHCVKNTPGVLVYNKLRDIFAYNEYFCKGQSIDKDEYSIFSDGNEHGEELYNILWEYNVENKDFNIYIAGLAGDYCVLNTIKDLIKLGFQDNIVILKDCIASIDGGKALNNLIKEGNLRYE